MRAVGVCLIAMLCLGASGCGSQPKTTLQKGFPGSTEQDVGRIRAVLEQMNVAGTNIELVHKALLRGDLKSAKAGIARLTAAGRAIESQAETFDSTNLRDEAVAIGESNVRLASDYDVARQDIAADDLRSVRQDRLAIGSDSSTLVNELQKFVDALEVGLPPKERADLQRGFARALQQQ